MTFKNRKALVIVSLLLYVSVLFTNNLGNAVMPVFLKETKFGTEIFGYLTACMFLGQFLIAPVWGKLSDQKGRWVMMFSPIGYGIGQLLYIFSRDSFFLLVFSRVFSGVFAILFLSQFVAYISDVTPEKYRKNVLAITAAMVPLGTGVAYLVGGLLKSPSFEPVLLFFRNMLSFLGEDLSFYLTQHYTLPFLIQFFLGGILAFFIYQLVSNNNQYQVMKKAPVKRAGFKDFFSLSKYKGTIVFSIVLITFFNSLAYSATQSIQYYLQDALGQSPQEIGFTVFLFNIGSVIISLIIQPIFIKKFSDWMNFLIANAVVILMAVLLNFSSAVTLVLIMIIVIMMNTLLVSISQSILASSSEDERGLLIGMNQSAQSFGSIVGNFLISPLYAFMPHIMKYRLPFVMMAVVLLVVTLIIMGPLKKQMHEPIDAV